MGSLSSRPKVPSQPQVVYVPAPSQYTPPPQTNAPQTETPSPQDTASKAREQNLLRRSRGIFGTVQTGFRGLLSSASSNARKSLLGE